MGKLEPDEEFDSATSLLASLEYREAVALVPRVFSCFAGQRAVVRPLTDKPQPFLVGLGIAAHHPTRNGG